MGEEGKEIITKRRVQVVKVDTRHKENLVILDVFFSSQY